MSYRLFTENKHLRLEQTNQH